VRGYLYCSKIISVLSPKVTWSDKKYPKYASVSNVFISVLDVLAGRETVARYLISSFSKFIEKDPPRRIVPFLIGFSIWPLRT
jgi:hypothetical protein